MRIRKHLLPAAMILSLVLSLCVTHPCAGNELVMPEDHFGFRPGTDRMLLDYTELISYLKTLAPASPKLKLMEHGRSPLGKQMYIAFISSADNLAQLDDLKAINRRLALEPEVPANQLSSMLDKGKVFLLATLSMHSSEVGPSQAAPLIVHELLTTTDSETLKWLDDVVLMMVPCHNPDGMDMVVNNYKKYKGTKYEGSPLPGIYHKYAGHNINRDFVTLSQSDNRAVAAIYTQDWYPQVLVEKHQMGSTGPRYFVPPMHDPIAENVPGQLWNWTWIFGSNMNTDMGQQGQTGISQHYLFDDYWPGSTETCLWKGCIGLLTEAASVKTATPIFIEENELSVRGKGLSEYEKGINMSMPWPGGWWRLGDIVDYEMASTLSLIKTSSLHRRDILEFRHEMCRTAFAQGRAEAPYYYIFPREQHDQSELVDLVNLLRRHNVKVYELNTDLTLTNQNHHKGDIVVPLAQAFRPFIKEVLETQVFPLRHYTPGGKIIKPYDITSWCLPLHRGVKAIEIQDPKAQIPEPSLTEVDQAFALTIPGTGEHHGLIFKASNNESYKAAFLALEKGLKVERLTESLEGHGVSKGSFVIRETEGSSQKIAELLGELKVSPIFLIGQEPKLTKVRVTAPRIALVETYYHDMDAGWTRFIFDNYHISYSVVRPGDFASTDFAGTYDTIVFPSVSKSLLMKGKNESDGKPSLTSYPPEYTKGIGDKGMEKLMTFLDKGGTILAWGGSAELFMGVLKIKRGEEDVEEFQLPVRDITKQVTGAGLYCPGSLLKIQLAKDHPLTLGMPEEIGVFTRGRPVFSTRIPNFDMDRRVIGHYAKRDVLLSGYCEGQEQISHKTAMVWLKKGKGQLVLYGFNPQFRASTQAAFKLLFNGILLPDVE